MARVLILDNDAGVASLIAEVIRGTGHEVRVTSTGRQFFYQYDIWAPSFLVIDLVIPDQDGVEILRQLSVLACRAEIIIVSGVDSRTMNAAARLAREHGLKILATLNKPFPVQALSELFVGSRSTETYGEPSLWPQASVEYDAKMLPDLSRADLWNALENEELELVFQPQISCEDGALIGFESLARWHHPVAGYITPQHFIPGFEQHNLMPFFTRWVFESALGWFSGLLSGLLEKNPPGSGPGVERLSLAVNISARNLTQIEFVDDLEELCAALNIEPNQIVLELSETSAMKDPMLSLDLLTRLRVCGFRLSIDDFGSGYSSMLQLVRLPFSEIKVDKSFVTTASHSSESRLVIRSIVELGRSLGLCSLAEGVEDQVTMDFLASIGCDTAQGYLICPPLPGDKILPWMATRSH